MEAKWTEAHEEALQRAKEQQRKAVGETGLLYLRWCGYSGCGELLTRRKREDFEKFLKRDVCGAECRRRRNNERRNLKRGKGSSAQSFLTEHTKTNTQG